MSNLQLVNNLKILRKKNLMTQQQVGDMLNISRQAYSNYETGKRAPEIGLLAKLSDFYHVTLDDMVKQTISPYNGAGIIRERKGPYTTAMKIKNTETLYLTDEEVTVIMMYRTLSPDDKRIVDRILKHQGP